MATGFWREDWGECSFRPPCGHDGGGQGGQIPRNSVDESGVWTCPTCGLSIEITGSSPVPSDNWADADVALVTWPDGRLELCSVCDV